LLVGEPGWGGTVFGGRGGAGVHVRPGGGRGGGAGAGHGAGCAPDDPVEESDASPASPHDTHAPRPAPSRPADGIPPERCRPFDRDAAVGHDKRRRPGAEERPMRTLILALLVPAAARAEEVTVVDHPPPGAPTVHYVGTREPLLPTPLVKLPVGSVRPGGWLRKQLELEAAGFFGRLGEISPYLRKGRNAWLSPKGVGDHGWEEV